jgi:hypothetical protein
MEDRRPLQPKTKRRMTKEEKVAYKTARKRGACSSCRHKKAKVCNRLKPHVETLLMFCTYSAHMSVTLRMPRNWEARVCMKSSSQCLKRSGTTFRAMKCHRGHMKQVMSPDGTPEDEKQRQNHMRTTNGLARSRLRGHCTATMGELPQGLTPEEEEGLTSCPHWISKSLSTIMPHHHHRISKTLSTMMPQHHCLQRAT